MKTVYEIRHYLSSNGKDIYMQWWDKLRDHKARLALDRRVNRVALGNFGDHKYLRDGVLNSASMSVPDIASTTPSKERS